MTTATAAVNRSGSSSAHIDDYHSRQYPPIGSEQLLQRAAEQLQDAIRSARKHRDSLGSGATVSPRPPSPTCERTDIYSRNNKSLHCTDLDTDNPYSLDDDDSDDSDDSDKENARSNVRLATAAHSNSSKGVISNSHCVTKALYTPATSKALANAHLVSRQTTQSLSDDLALQLSSLSSSSSNASLSEDDDRSRDDDSSRDANIATDARYTMSEYERRGILRMSELSRSRLSQSDLELLTSHRDIDPSIKAMTHRALVWMQRDSETQARETRAMRERLVDVIATLHSVFSDLQAADASPTATADTVTTDGDALHWRELSIERVDALVCDWERVLLTWRSAAAARESEMNEREALAGEDLAAQLQHLRVAHARERDALKAQVAALAAQVEQQQSASVQPVRYEDAASEAAAAASQRLVTPLSFTSNKSEWLSPATAVTTLSPPSERVIALERANLDLTAQLKTAELCFLHAQAAQADAVATAQQHVEHMGMLAEDAMAAHTALQTANRHVATLSTALTQQVAQLRAVITDVQQQVACDREQFDYEQRKAAVEREQTRRDVDEVQTASVNVLKLVLLREQALKADERRCKRRMRALAACEQRVGQQVEALRRVISNVMHDAALFVVALQEHTTSCERRSSAVQVKPVTIKRMLKRLRSIDAALAELRVKQQLAATTSDDMTQSDSSCGRDDDDDRDSIVRNEPSSRYG